MFFVKKNMYLLF